MYFLYYVYTIAGEEKIFYLKIDVSTMVQWLNATVGYVTWNKTIFSALH